MRNPGLFERRRAPRRVGAKAVGDTAVSTGKVACGDGCWSSATGRLERSSRPKAEIAGADLVARKRSLVMPMSSTRCPAQV